MTTVAAETGAAGELALARPKGLLIDGEWVAPTSGKWIDADRLARVAGLEHSQILKVLPDESR